MPGQTNYHEKFQLKHLFGHKKVDYACDELIVLTLVKDAEIHIQPFIDHYLRLGVKHIVLLDNGSSDNTIDIAANYPQVSIFSCDLPFKNYNLKMRQQLIQNFGRKDRWILCVDIDEFFDYPCSDQLKLNAFLQYLNSEKYTAMVASMLDMFSDQAISDIEHSNGNICDEFPYYDISSVRALDYWRRYPYHGNSDTLKHMEKLENTLDNPDIKLFVGGIRASHFNMKNVLLFKHPLMFMDGKTELVHQHFVNKAVIADITGLLCHYKFVYGFYDKVLDAIKNKQYWNNSEEYRNYYHVIKENPDICLKTGTARKLESVNDLIESGFLQVTGKYLRWINNQNRPT